MPLAVESTACLLELKHRYLLVNYEWGAACDNSLTTLLYSDQPSSRVNESILKLQYALCLIRLVNGVTDSAQKGKVASLVSSSVSMAGTAACTQDAQASLGPGPADRHHFVQRCQEYWWMSDLRPATTTCHPSPCCDWLHGCSMLLSIFTLYQATL